MTFYYKINIAFLNRKPVVTIFYKNKDENKKHGAHLSKRSLIIKN